MVTETAKKDQGKITLNQVKHQKEQKSLSRNVGERVSVTEANTNKTTEQSSKGLIPPANNSTLTAGDNNNV